MSSSDNNSNANANANNSAATVVVKIEDAPSAPPVLKRQRACATVAAAGGDFAGTTPKRARRSSEERKKYTPKPFVFGGDIILTESDVQQVTTSTWCGRGANAMIKHLCCETEGAAPKRIVLQLDEVTALKVGAGYVKGKSPSQLFAVVQSEQKPLLNAVYESLKQKYPEYSAKNILVDPEADESKISVRLIGSGALAAAIAAAEDKSEINLKVTLSSWTQHDKKRCGITMDAIDL